MIDISSLEQYFPQINKPLEFDEYTFRIIFRQDKDTFVINLEIKQKDTKDTHLIQFKFGIGKDAHQDGAVHDTDKPHFEIKIYKRDEQSVAVTVYFTFNNTSDEEIQDYAKGTVSLIDKIIKQFIENKKIEDIDINKIIYDTEVSTDLSEFEPMLIEALYECYKHSDLIVREGTRATKISTIHNFRKYLGIDSGVQDLNPLLLPLLEKIKEEEK